MRSGEMLTKDPRRTAGKIISRAQILANARKKKEAAQRARERAKRQREQAEKRKQHLKSLAGKQSILWTRVDLLIATRQPKQYNEAVSLLQDLRDLAEMQKKRLDFSFRVTSGHHGLDPLKNVGTLLFLLKG